ncbi:hypothetical protein HHX47_DHR2000931 [Lentinula edodes]|nr:hypothetical protein HHX47_DHR2000931 [Lentinula edodes]
MDVLYTFLEGLVKLVEDEREGEVNINGVVPVVTASTSNATNALELLDLSNKTLITVIADLDTTMFQGYSKPRAVVVTSLVLGGILDESMGWYETIQPKGPCTNHECGGIRAGTDTELPSGSISIRGIDTFQADEEVRDGQTKTASAKATGGGKSRDREVKDKDNAGLRSVEGKVPLHSTVVRNATSHRLQLLQ